MPISLSLKQLFTNNAVTLLAAPISATSTSMTVMTGYGQLFPNPGANEYFLVTLENQAGTAREIIKVTGRTGDVFTFALSDRGQEGTVPQAWGASSGNDTLVDHRVTAETMDRALALPVAGLTGVAVQDHGVAVPPDATTLNFEGDVSVSGSGSTKTITIGASSAASIHGESAPPIVVDPGWTIPGNVAVYSNTQRGFKFFVTITMPANYLSSSFEVLGNISGNLNANTETVSFNRVSRVGHKFLGEVNLTLDTALKEVSLTWTNNEANPVVIQCVRIQHQA